jgi:glycerol-3-phosphate dehydrogenase subunit B
MLQNGRNFMKSDVVVIGAELESFVAAARLAEHGARVRLLMPGSGSLHYSAGGLGVLATEGNGSPFSSMSRLGHQHPYVLLGAQQVEAALEWFLAWLERHCTAWLSSAGNVHALTMLGRSASQFAVSPSLATLESLRSRNLAVVEFAGYRDFPAGLFAAGLAKQGVAVSVAAVAAPVSGDGVQIARFLDHDDGSFFNAVAEVVPRPVDAVVFPAVLGLRSAKEVRRLAGERLRADVYEVATLPPTLFGLRLHELFLKHLTTAGVHVHPDIRGLHAEFETATCRFLRDEKGQRYEADSFILANGGILLGGLEVDSFGNIHEPICGLDVVQTDPLKVRDPLQVTDSLHRAGVSTDRHLRPFRNGQHIANLFATGSLLAHWNPIEELSGEGVAIASGIAAADFALEGCRP